MPGFHYSDFEPSYSPAIEALVDCHAESRGDHAIEQLNKVYEILTEARTKLDLLPPLDLPLDCTWANDPRAYANQLHELAVEVAQTREEIKCGRHIPAIRDELMGDVREGCDPREVEAE
jgi:hypothetical protein